MNLIVNSITMVDLTNKEAKRIIFSPGKNMLTSSGNHLGKSVIMKSLYYTLGAEVYFPNPIKRLNLLTYLDFSLNNVDYRVSRLKNAFALYSNGAFIGNYTSVGDFEEKLCEIFDLEINLVGKDVNGTITKCPPAFYYLPYYIDQENGWAANSFSFDKMTQFDMPQRKNSYFFHLGALDNSYVRVSKISKANERQISTLTKENEKYSTVVETLKDGLDYTQMSFNLNDLEKAISIRQNEINNLLDSITKTREKLISTEDQLLQISHEKEILSKYIKKKHAMDDCEIDEILECPRCGMVFERSISRKLEKLYLIESLHSDYANITAQENQLLRSIERLKKLFERQQSTLQNYEKSLTADQESYNIYVKSKATNQILKEYHEKIGENIATIERLRKESSEVRKLLTEYHKARNQAKLAYQVNFNRLIVDLDIPSEQIEEDSEPGSSLIASGAYGPRCKIAQMLAFVETQHNKAPGMISFPLVIDSPNSLEQDKDHLDSVMRTLFTWDKTDNQIIVASIEGKDTATSIEDVNIIILNNEKNHLFSKDEYLVLEQEISEIFTKF